jgi:uncharacterized membrane protein YeaQ/YmgE (transglycosylase-associated protein family)
MFQLLWILIVGLILGAIARLLLSGKQDIPIWLTMLAGVVGALLGNAVSGWIGVRHTGGVDWIRHLLQLGFAVALVALASGMYAGRKGARR